MKKTYLAVATLMFTMTGAALALDPPRYGKQNGQQQGQPADRGNGRQAGPRDGSGPIHEPGTGGGTGAGQGRGKMTGPRDGSGPIHAPGTGGGTGAGQRRGRK
ncbi:MAG: hypothetical protein IT159_08850 [Bryobacterales bacterium]|nr:hypothetical protein [Bryobacterales bacterium]